MNKITGFILDDSGKFSMSRLLAGIVVISYVGYAGYVAYHTKTLPDIPMGVTTLVGSLYAVNKFSPTVPFTGGN